MSGGGAPWRAGSIAQMMERNKAGLGKGELSQLEPGAMSFITSKGAYLTDDDDHNLSHFMFCTPPLDGKTLGSRSAEVTGYVESTVQGRGTDQRVCCSRGQVVKRNDSSDYVRRHLVRV